MKITAIETIQNKNFSNFVWVKIHTDEGITGLGETFRNPNAIVSYIHESCAPYLLGKDPLRINEHADNLLNWTANRNIGFRNIIVLSYSFYHYSLPVQKLL